MINCSYPVDVRTARDKHNWKNSKHGKTSSRSLLIITALLLLGPILIAFSPTVQGESTNVRVGIIDNYPLIAPDDEGGAKGIYADLTDYVAQEEGWVIEYVNASWAECIRMLESGEIDILTDIAHTEARSPIYNFTQETVIVNWGELYVRENSRIETFTDLDGHKVSVLQNDVYFVGENGLNDLLTNFDVMCDFEEKDRYEEVFKAIENGTVDAGLVNRLFGIQNKQDFAVKRSPMIFSPIELKYAFPKNGTQSSYLAERIDFYLTFLKRNEDSLYYRSIDQHLGQQTIADESPEEKDDDHSIQIALSLVIIVMMIIIYLAKVKFSETAKNLTDKNQLLQERITKLEQQLKEVQTGICTSDEQKLDRKQSGLQNEDEEKLEGVKSMNDPLEDKP